MGKTGKGYNWKARQSNATYQHLVQPEVEVDIEVEKEKYDEANVFLLSSKKQKNKKALHKPVPEGKPLSKKQKKRLELTLKKKTAGQNRKQLLEKLKDVQATSKELSLMTSVAEAQTMGVKRLTSGLVKYKEEAEHKVPKAKINSIKGSYKRKNKERLIVRRRESSTSLSDSDSEESIVAETVNISMKSTEVHGQTENHIVCVNKTEVQTESTTVDDSSAEKEMQADSALLRKEETEMKVNSWLDKEKSLHFRGKSSWEFLALLKMMRLEQAERRAIRKDIDFILSLLRTACPSCIDEEKQQLILQHFAFGCASCANREKEDLILHSMELPF